MKKSALKKETLMIALIIIMFVFMSYLSLTSINQLRGNARVVNYAGIVRGGTQRLIKKELQGYPDDILIRQLDSILDELMNGKGKNRLTVLPDKDYLDFMYKVLKNWNEIREEIILVRKGGNNSHLFDLSENYFMLVDKAVSAAEIYSEKHVKNSRTWMIGINLIFIILIIGTVISYIRSASLKKRSETLGKLAYQDFLTQIPNRASCDKEIDRLVADPPKEPLAVFMFDMNNLKYTNDLLGHQSGDRIISDFARILKQESDEFGFVGRYGGDEFLAVFEAANEEKVQSFLNRINERVISYNRHQKKKAEKLSFAVGYIIDTMQDISIYSMMKEADRNMYIRKRRMKEIDRDRNRD